ncbi:MAG: glycosyltransferase [Elusimicrobiota bacterium]|jgi:rhamnosyltransferase|nr:glycosyltransferase [Elusimicrobiota bacterium]
MICALIVSYNSRKVFRCYESVKNQVDFTLIVDNGSRDKDIIEGLLKIQKENPKSKIIFNNQNLGIAKALNQGALYAKNLNSKWLLTLDDDSQLNDDTVFEIIKDFNNLPSEIKEKTAVLALKYQERNIDNAPKTQNINISVKSFKPVKYALTSGNFIKTSVFDCGISFDEKLFIDQVDNDFDFTIRKKGFIILESQKRYIVHELGLSQKKRGFIIKNYSPIRRYYLSRNCIYILKRYLFFDFLGVSRIFIGAIFGGIFKITFFEKQKFEKYKYICFGIIDAIFNKMGKKYNP